MYTSFCMHVYIQQKNFFSKYRLNLQLSLFVLLKHPNLELYLVVAEQPIIENAGKINMTCIGATLHGYIDAYIT